MSSSDEDLLEATIRGILVTPAPFHIGALLDSNNQEREKKKNHTCKWSNCDHFLSGTAVVKALWNKCQATEASRCAGMSPIMVEILFYLKEKYHLWTNEDLLEALSRMKTSKKKSRTANI